MASIYGRERTLPFCVRRCKSGKELMAILSGGQRLEIILALATAGRPLSVQMLMHLLDLDSPMVSKNLRILREKGLVEYRSEKKLHWYRPARSISVTPDGQFLRVFEPRSSRPELLFRIPSALPETGKRGSSIAPRTSDVGSPDMEPEALTEIEPATSERLIETTPL